MKCPRCGCEMMDAGVETTRTMRMPTYRKMRLWVCPGCGNEAEVQTW